MKQSARETVLEPRDQMSDEDVFLREVSFIKGEAVLEALVNASVLEDADYKALRAALYEHYRPIYQAKGSSKTLIKPSK